MHVPEAEYSTPKASHLLESIFLPGTRMRTDNGMGFCLLGSQTIIMRSEQICSKAAQDYTSRKCSGGRKTTLQVRLVVVLEKISHTMQA
jgi:hypothetical protein